MLLLKFSFLSPEGDCQAGSPFNLFYIYTVRLFPYRNGKCLIARRWEHAQVVPNGVPMSLFLCYIFPYTFYPVRWATLLLVNRVENQKLNHTTAELPFG